MALARPLFPMCVLLVGALLCGCPTTDGPCKTTDDCKKGFTCCAGRCTDLQNDKANCGACGEACELPNVVPACRVGRCQLTCVTGFGNCNGVRDDGCELDLTGDVTNCGLCSKACTTQNATPVCKMSVCGAGTCDTNFANCDADSTNGCEIDTRTDDAHCGGCGRACMLPHATSHCVSSACAVATCAAPFGDCDGQAPNGCETDTTSNSQHCGRCGYVCGPGQTCVSSLCRANELIVFGGMLGFTGSGATAELHKFDLVTKSWVAINATAIAGSPPARGRHVAFWDQPRNRMVVWGGVDGAGTPVPTDLWALDFATEPPAWKQVTVTGTPPSPRFNPVAALDPTTSKVWLFGGTTELGGGLSDLWTLDLATNTWTMVHDHAAPNAPGNRLNAMGAFDPVAKVFLVFGGNDAVIHSDLSELWQYDVAANAWKNPPLTALTGGPPARARGAFWGGHPVFLFSGIGALYFPPSTVPQDLRTLDVSAMTPWALLPGTLTVPDGRFNAGFTTRDASLFLYSGGTALGAMPTTFADLWRYDPSSATWTKLHDGTGTIPLARLAMSVVAR